MLRKKFKIPRKFLGVAPDFWAITILFLVFSLVFSLFSIIRHNHFQSQGIDFSIYDQSLWLYSKFENPHNTIGNLHDLADRFRPIMLPLSSLYWFTNNERVLLVFQSVILASAVFPIWLLAKNNVPRILAIIIAFLYVDFVGIQSAIAYDFHEMAILPFFLALLFYLIHKESWKSFFVILVICLGIREHVGLLLSTLGFYIWTSKRKGKIALSTFLISILWSLVAIKVAMPFLGQRTYSSFVLGGDTLEEALLGYITKPYLIIGQFFYPLEKMSVLFWSFLSFGMIPFVSIQLLPIIIFQFASRFLDTLHPIRWTIYYHYSVELAVLLAVSTIYGVKRLSIKFKKFTVSPYLIASFLILAHTITNISLYAPLKNLLKINFYKSAPWMKNNNLILSLVPEDASVATQNNLVPHLSHRKEVYLLPNTGNAEFIIMDLHEGQNEWNFYSQNLKKTKSQFTQIITSGEYKTIYSSGDTYLLRKLD